MAFMNAPSKYMGVISGERQSGGRNLWAMRVAVLGNLKIKFPDIYKFVLSGFSLCEYSHHHNN